MVDGKFASKATYDAAGRGQPANLKRELAALKRARESLYQDVRNDRISHDDYSIIENDLSEQIEMIERALFPEDFRRNPRRNGTKKGQRRKTSRRAYEKNPFGAEFLFI